MFTLYKDTAVVREVSLLDDKLMHKEEIILDLKKVALSRLGESLYRLSDQETCYLLEGRLEEKTFDCFTCFTNKYWLETLALLHQPDSFVGVAKREKRKQGRPRKNAVNLPNAGDLLIVAGGNERRVKENPCAGGCGRRMIQRGILCQDCCNEKIIKEEMALRRAPLKKRPIKI